VNDFRKKILKVNQTRKHKNSNSLGLFHAYWEAVRKGLFKSAKVSRTDYSKIIKTVNRIIIENVLNGSSIELPCKMGSIYILKREPKISYKDGKLKTTL
jgi:hypothetical protein